MSNGGISRRRLLIAGASLPAAFYLAACSDSGGGSGTKSLSVSDWLGPQVDQYLPRMEQLTGVKIDHQVSAYAPEKLMTQLANGTAADIFNIDATSYGDVFPHKELYVPFDDALKARGIDKAKWSADPSVENGYDGKITGLSLATAQDFIVHVNQGMAEQSGLLADAPLWGKPNFDTWNWDTFVDWLKAGTKRMQNGTVTQYGLASLRSSAYLFSAWLHDFGGTLFDDDWHYDETVSKLDSEESIATAQKFADLVLKHQVAVPPGIEATAANQGGSYLGKLGMCAITLSTGTIFPEAGHFPMTYFHMPYSVNKIHLVGLSVWCVNARCKDPQTALDWVISLETDLQVRTKFLEISSVPAYDPLPIVNASPEGNAKVIANINLSRVKGLSPVPNDTAGVVTFPRWFGRYASADTQTAIKSALDQVMAGKATPRDAMTQAKQTVDKKIADGRRAAGK